jgi:hypothetical protein
MSAESEPKDFCLPGDPELAPDGYPLWAEQPNGDATGLTLIGKQVKEEMLRRARDQE